MDNYKFFQREKTLEVAMRALNFLRSQRIRALVDEEKGKNSGYVISVHESDMDEANALLATSLYQAAKRRQIEKVVDHNVDDIRLIDKTLFSHLSGDWVQAFRVVDMCTFELGVDVDCEGRLFYLMDQGIIEYQFVSLDYSGCEVRVSVKPLIEIGLWNSEEVDHYIHPGELMVPDYYEDKEKLVAYLDSGEVFQSRLDETDCLLGCGESELGTTDLTDGVWLWPQALSHYVDKHDVALPEKFLSHVRDNNWQIPYVCLPESVSDDDAFWIEYCENHRRQGKAKDD